MPDIKTVTINDTVYDIKDETARNALNTCEKVIIAEMTSLDTLVPFYCEAGDVIVITSSDGTSFKPSQLRLFDESKTQKTYWGITGSNSPRTITNPTTKPNTYFVSISGGTAQTVNIVNVTKRDLSYNNSIAKNEIDKLQSSINEVSVDVLDIQVSKNRLNLDDLVNGYYKSPTQQGTDSRYWYNPNGYVVNPGEYVYVSYSANNSRRTDSSIRSYVLLNLDGTVAQSLLEDLNVLNANYYKYHNETENTYLIVPNFWFSQGTDFALYITNESPASFNYLAYYPYSRDSKRLVEIESGVEEAQNILDRVYYFESPANKFTGYRNIRYYLQTSTNYILPTQTDGTNYKCFGIDLSDLTGSLYIFTKKASGYREIFMSENTDSPAVSIGNFNYLNVESYDIGTITDIDDDQLITIDLAKFAARYPTTRAIYLTVSIEDVYDCYTVLEKKSINPDLYADNSIPQKALKNGNLYVKAIPSLLLENAEVAHTAQEAGTYKSTSESHTLEDLGLSVGDKIYVTIDSQEGCADSSIFSLEAYNLSTRLLQKFISKTSMETEMVIPEGTTRLAFVYRLCMTTSVEAGATATWSGVKLYYYVKEAGKKIIPSYYYVPNAITDTDLAELETKTERSLLFDQSVYGNADAAIEGAFSTIGRKKFLMLAWISDLHRRPFTGTADAPVANPDSVFYNTVELVKYLNKRLPLHAVLDTGDIILGSQPFLGFTADVNFKYESEYIRSFNEACELYLYSPGNHDGYNANSVSLQDTEYQIGASVLNSKIESKQPGKCYYYIDYPDISTRLLVLAIPGGGSNLGMDAEQLQWLVSTGLGTVPDGYGVIMAYHIPTVCISYLEGGVGGFGNRVCFEGIVNAFHNHTTYSDSIVTADFSNKTNTKIVASLCGHMHFDEVSNPGELFTRDKGRDGTSKAGESLTNNLPCKQIMMNATFNRVVDILIYVPEDNMIYTKRIGTGSNKEIQVN